MRESRAASIRYGAVPQKRLGCSAPLMFLKSVFASRDAVMLLKGWETMWWSARRRSRSYEDLMKGLLCFYVNSPESTLSTVSCGCLL